MDKCAGSFRATVLSPLPSRSLLPSVVTLEEAGKTGPTFSLSCLPEANLRKAAAAAGEIFLGFLVRQFSGGFVRGRVGWPTARSFEISPSTSSGCTGCEVGSVEVEEAPLCLLFRNSRSCSFHAGALRLGDVPLAIIIAEE